MNRKVIGAFVLGLVAGGLCCVVTLKHTERLAQEAMVLRQDQGSVTILFNHDSTDQTLVVKVPVSRFPTSGGKYCGVAVTGHLWPEFDGQTDELMQTNAWDLERKYLEHQPYKLWFEDSNFFRGDLDSELTMEGR